MSPTITDVDQSDEFSTHTFLAPKDQAERDTGLIFTHAGRMLERMTVTRLTDDHQHKMFRTLMWVTSHQDEPDTYTITLSPVDWCEILSCSTDQLREFVAAVAHDRDDPRDPRELDVPYVASELHPETKRIGFWVPELEKALRSKVLARKRLRKHRGKSGQDR